MSVVHILVSACFCAVHVCVCEHLGYILNLDWLYKLGVSVVYILVSACFFVHVCACCVHVRVHAVCVVCVVCV